MSKNRYLTRSAAVAACLVVGGLTAAPTAAAHVSADPEEAAKGDHARIAFVVPNERDDAGTVRVKVTFPLEHPLSSVRTKPMAGWTAQVETVPLPKPVKVAGSEVTEAVASITWTAEPGTRIAPDQYAEFEASLGTLPTDTERLVIPAEQTYDSGEVVRWDAPPPADGAPEPEHPAPTITLVEDGAGGHSHGESSAAPEAEPSTSDSTARTLGGAGLAVGALGVGIGIGALLRGRKRSDS